MELSSFIWEPIKFTTLISIIFYEMKYISKITKPLKFYSITFLQIINNNIVLQYFFKLPKECINFFFFFLPIKLSSKTKSKRNLLPSFILSRIDVYAKSFF